MKDLKCILMEALNESILNTEEIDNIIDNGEKYVDAMNEEYLKSILQQYVQNMKDLKKYEWVDDTLSLTFASSSYIQTLQKMIDKIDCKKLLVNGYLTVYNTPSLKNLCIDNKYIVFKDPCKFENCELKGDPDCTVEIQADAHGGLTIKNTTIGTTSGKTTLEFKGFDGINKCNFQGSNFDKVTRLIIRGFGSNVQNIISGWNFREIENGGITGSIRGSAALNKAFVSSIDPIKELGLDKYFKNLEELYIPTKQSSHNYKFNTICITRDKSQYGYNVDKTRYAKKLDSGWTIDLSSGDCWLGNYGNYFKFK